MPCNQLCHGDDLGSGNQQLHVVMFPWVAFGHAIPYIKLARYLADKGHLITFLSTTRIMDALPNGFKHHPLIQFVPLRLPGGAGAAQATADVAPEEVQNLEKVFDEGLKGPLLSILKGEYDGAANQGKLKNKPVDWIIHDFTQYWVIRMAKQLGIRTAYMSVFSAAALCFSGTVEEIMGEGRSRSVPEHFTVQPKWMSMASHRQKQQQEKSSGAVAFLLHEARWWAYAYETNASGVSEMVRFGTTVRDCDAVLVRSCEEYESEYLDLLSRLYNNKPVIPVGLLPPPPLPDFPSANGSSFRSNHLLFDWLQDNRHKPRSVLYVALGSEFTLSLDQFHQLALGLEQSGVPFLWALRRPVGLDAEAELLPTGFAERVADRAVIHMGWVPQHEILAHESIGGFLTHAGWGSTVEGLQMGLPLVLLPIAVEQGLNARVMAHKLQVGVEVPRDELMDGYFTSDEVAEAVSDVMLRKAEAFTANVRKTQHIFADPAIQDRCIQRLIGAFSR